MNFSSAETANSVAPFVKVATRSVLVLSSALTSMASLRGCAARGGDDPEVGAAFVDDPFAVAADARPANAFVLVAGELHRRRLHGACLDRRAPGATMLAGVPKCSLT